ncbi:MAG: ABC transporter substrate-binding protein [Spirochaetaceae bacterium]|jgi:branched-chain amino acid transport system substrate-binding protein|nr:ABC transporter substrate-binding protein [Spirochaetaceae bacterium]
MKKGQIIFFFGVLAVSLLGCKKDTGEIKIGLYGTITGSNALAGEMLQKGGELAVSQINAAGGVKGRPLNLVVYDDKSNPEGAVKAVTRLVDVDKVIAIAASNSSPNILATTQISEEAKVLQVGAGTSPAYTNAGFQYLFRGTTNGNLPNAACVTAMKDMGVKTIAILRVASEYGTSGIKSFVTLMENSIEVVAEEVYQTTDTDYTGQIAKILNTKPDGVLIFGMTNESALAIKQFRRNGYNGFIYGPESLGVPDIIKVAGEAADNTIFGSGAVVPASPNDANTEVEKKMLEAFVAAYGSMPVSDVVYRGYDSVMLIARALNNAEDITKPEAIREAFLKIKDYELIGGTYDFTNGSGDGLRTARAYIIQGGKNILYDNWKADR